MERRWLRELLGIFLLLFEDGVVARLRGALFGLWEYTDRHPRDVLIPLGEEKGPHPKSDELLEACVGALWMKTRSNPCGLKLTPAKSKSWWVVMS